MDALHAGIFRLSQLPINLDHISGSGFMGHVSNLDALDHIVQNLWCQFLDICVLLYGRIQLSPLHAPGKGLNLLQHIGLQHLVIHPVGLGTHIRMLIVVHAEVDIRFPIFELLFGNGQRVSAAFAEQFIAKQVKAFPIPRTIVP